MAQGFPYISAEIPALDGRWEVGEDDVTEIRLLPMGAFVLLDVVFNDDEYHVRYMLTPDRLILECGDPIAVAEPSGPKLVVPTNQLRPELS